MAELQDPSYLQGGSHTAQGDRLVIKSLVAAEGVVGADDLLVSEKSGTPDMSVDVAAGSVFIEGTQASFQGMYHGTNDAAVNLAIAAADATNPRIDLVIARVYDAFYSGATDDWALEVVTGTAEATPSEPSVPDNAVVLARIDVPGGASVTAITDAEITDRRTRSSSPTGLRAVVTFTSSGTFDKGDYPWLRAVRVRLVGGGGGGGASGTGGGSGGAGGGAGGYAETLVDVSDLAASETVTVGSGGTGGAGGAANPGGDGTASSFGAHAAADGGAGGVADGGGGGQGGLATAGTVQAGGGGGGAGISSLAIGGGGGNSLLGGGAAGQEGSAGGFDARGPGGGGGGGARVATGGVDGGDGADGIVIVELYA